MARRCEVVTDGTTVSIIDTGADVTPRGGVAATIASGIGPTVRQKTVTLTNANLLALTDPGTLFEIVPAPGANKVLLFQQGVLITNFVAGYTLPEGVTFANIVYGDYDDDASTKVIGTHLFSIANGNSVVSGLLPLSAAPPSELPGFADDVYWSLRARLSNQVNKPFKFYVESPSPYTWSGGDPANTLIASVTYLVIDTVTGVIE